MRTTRRQRPWALVVALGVLAVVVLGPWLAPHSATEPVGPAFVGPAADHLLGTDAIGRDVLSRVLSGGRTLVWLAALALTLSYALALVLGMLAGLRPRIDAWIMRPVDAFTVLPWFLLLAVVATAAGRGTLAIVLAAALGTVPWIVKVVRTATHELTTAGFVEAAQARGEPLRRLLLAEVLPNLRGVVLADAGVQITSVISMIAIGSFLGLGLRPPAPDWALMISENRSGLTLQPWAVVAPAAMIMLLIVSLNLIGDRWASPEAPPVRVLKPVAAQGGPVVEAVGLTVADADGRRLLDGVSLGLLPGRTVALVGHSGAGKTTLALALAGATQAGFTVSGEVRVAGGNGRAIGYVPQDPATGLNPALRIGTALREVGRAHGSAVDVCSALAMVGLPDDDAFAARYPHELSGGQQQRVLLALALTPVPRLVILDEPTTGLDAATRSELVDALARLRRETGTAFLIVTHDLAGVRPLVDDVLRLERGRLVPLGAARGADAGAPGVPVRRAPGGDRLVELRGVSVGYRRGRPVLADVDLDVGLGECVALVGASGAGKSTLARALAGLHPPQAGTMRMSGNALPGRAGARTVVQRRAVQFVFQNPRRSLNPRRTVGQELRRPSVLLRGLGRDAADAEARRLLELMRLEPALLGRRTGSLSGGQQQRVAIARALAAGPDLLICDEITTALDPETQDAVLDLLAGLREARGLALLLVSHDAAVVRRLADRTLRVADGEVSELRDPAPVVPEPLM